MRSTHILGKDQISRTLQIWVKLDQFGGILAVNSLSLLVHPCLEIEQLANLTGDKIWKETEVFESQV
jgi:hypothetical protein